MLRQRLESIGVSLPPGRRKATDLSLFTSLVEGIFAITTNCCRLGMCMTIANYFIYVCLIVPV